MAEPEFGRAPGPTSSRAGCATRRSSSSRIRTTGAGRRRSSASSSGTSRTARRRCSRCGAATSTSRSTCCPSRSSRSRATRTCGSPTHISLDFVYLALTHSAELNKALANKYARQAIAYAIDYDGIRDSLLGGSATRPANFIPVGSLGSTEELTKEIGFRQDLERSKKALAQAGLPDGFEFDVIYGNSIIAGTSYHVIGAEAAVRPRARRHQDEAESDAAGQRAHALQRRQDAVGDHVLESAGRRERAVGLGDGAAGREAPVAGSRPKRWSSSSTRRPRKRIRKSRPSCGASTRWRWWTKPT